MVKKLSYKIIIELRATELISLTLEVRDRYGPITVIASFQNKNLSYFIASRIIYTVKTTKDSWKSPFANIDPRFSDR